jgi:thymidylate synthase
MMTNIEHDYLRLLKDILDNGVEKQDRTGTGTRSVFGRQIRHKMSEGFPLLTTKKMPFKTIATELIWFLRGDTNIKFLVDNNCHIWDGDAYKAFEKWYDHMSKTTPFEVPRKLTQEELVKAITLDKWHEERFGDLGPIYGKQWRSWSRKTTREEKITRPGVYEAQIDQIANLINDLKTNPDSRRLMVNAWNVAEIDQMTLPPCHYGFQVYTRELRFEERHMIWHDEGKKANVSPLMESQLSDMLDRENIPTRAISLMWNQRSVDTFLGLPFNIASYGLLLEIIAKEVNMVPDELIGNLGDVHLYSNHIEQAKEQITREPMKLPELHCLDEYHYLMDEELVGPIPFNEKIEKFRPDFFKMNNYQAHPHIKAPLSN